MIKLTKNLFKCRKRFKIDPKPTNLSTIPLVSPRNKIIKLKKWKPFTSYIFAVFLCAAGLGAEVEPSHRSVLPAR